MAPSPPAFASVATRLLPFHLLSLDVPSPNPLWFSEGRSTPHWTGTSPRKTELDTVVHWVPTMCWPLLGAAHAHPRGGDVCPTLQVRYQRPPPQRGQQGHLNLGWPEASSHPSHCPTSVPAMSSVRPAPTLSTVNGHPHSRGGSETHA